MLQNSFHFHWCYKYGSTMKTDLRYTPSDVFETFPVPQNLLTQTESALENVGQDYHEHRRQLMLKTQLGLTKIYNQFHNLQFPGVDELDSLSQNSFTSDGSSPNFPSPEELSQKFRSSMGAPQLFPSPGGLSIAHT